MTPSCPESVTWPMAAPFIALIVTFGAIYIVAMVTRAFRERTVLWAHSPPKSEVKLPDNFTYVPLCQCQDATKPTKPVYPAGLPPVPPWRVPL